jgi:hypothetical protein
MFAKFVFGDQTVTKHYLDAFSSMKNLTLALGDQRQVSFSYSLFFKLLHLSSGICSTSSSILHSK